MVRGGWDLTATAATTVCYRRNGGDLDIQRNRELLSERRSQPLLMRDKRVSGVHWHCQY